MITYLPKIETKQRRLFDEPLGNHGHVRTLIGEWTEQIVAGLLGGVRLRTSGLLPYCPDVQIGRTFVESKAAGLSRTTFIYHGRLERDRVFSESNTLVYAILQHKTHTKLASYVEELRVHFVRSIQRLYVVPFAAIDTVCSGVRCEKLNSGYGKKDGVKNAERYYGSGYRLPLKQLEDFIVMEWNHG